MERCAHGPVVSIAAILMRLTHMGAARMSTIAAAEVVALISRVVALISGGVRRRASDASKAIREGEIQKPPFTRYGARIPAPFRSHANCTPLTASSVRKYISPWNQDYGWAGIHPPLNGSLQVPPGIVGKLSV